MQLEQYGGSVRSPLFSILLLVLLLACVRVADAQLDRYYYLRRAHEAYQDKRYTEAIVTLRDYLDYRPDDRIGLYLRALCKYQLGDHRGAKRDLDRLLGRHPFAVDALMLRGIVTGELGAPGEGMKDLQQGVELRPSSAGIRFMRGIGYFMLKDYPSAIADFSVQLEHEPQHLNARLNRGTAYLLHGDTLSARRDYLDAIIAHPFDPSPHIHLARFYYVGQHMDSARQQVDEALELDPQSAQALIMRALIQGSGGQLRGAVETLTQVIALTPQNSMAYYNRGQLYMQLKEYRLAARDYEAASRISPRNIFIRYNLALAHLALGQLALADRSLSVALAICPEFTLGYGLRAEVRLGQGRRREAKRDYDASRRLAGRYRRGELGDLSDTGKRYDVLMAFEEGFSTGQKALENEPAGDRPLPLARIVEGGEQDYEEWVPIRYLPDSTQLGRLRMAIEHPGEGGAHSPTRLALESLAEQNPLLRPLASYRRAVESIDRLRYAAVDSQDGIAARQGYKPIATNTDYSRPIAQLEQLQVATPSPYIDYTLATAYYLQRQPERAEELLTRAIASWPNFAEAYFNRGLIRLLLEKEEQACQDLSRAGELGIRQAYRAIASSCRGGR
ncbi:MAG: hypothetical protein CSA97_00980 [Bacteroidetes bacterium]|nr:MAG: hypothetical protein CSA97_00980 [Bacteroidota bacterium]